MRHLALETETNLDALCPSDSGPIGVAVSGGGDSLALLHIVSDWARARGKDVLCLTVDHGLRPEAAREAALVANQCKALKLDHETLTWCPPRGHVGQAMSRRARHRLLSEALRAAGGALLLMGHTLDDQIETLAMRGARAGSDKTFAMAGIRKLSVSPVWPEGRDVFLVRPLLDVSRADLRIFLQSKGAHWVEDPTNLDRTYERVRVRQDMDQARVSKLKRAHHSALATRSSCDQELAAWLGRDVRADEYGLISVQAVAGLDQDELAEGLAWLLMVAAGSDKRADRAGRLQLAQDIQNGFKTFRARTLGGAWIAPRQGKIHIARDPGGVSDTRAGLMAGAIWDGRFLVEDTSKCQNGTKLAQYDHIQTNIHQISPMARSTYPAFEGDGRCVTCLVENRLKDIELMLRVGSGGAKLTGGPTDG